ncbi:type IV pilus biogenesis stability [Brachionus plicatilis]|uniref:Type IV pilus biogenesis stability n=1 Tax=Brachionus plicatilis TaxID=10195 RepID=A0A3M7QW04_BRAPC|nr:type IV pilus biogenesis stability [Brachionus plicatilis]
MPNLVELYLVKGDPDNALMWHNRALENKSLYSISSHESVLKSISELKRQLKLAKIPENKSMDSFMKEKFPQFNMLNNFYSKTYPNSIKNNDYDPRMLMEHANKGSPIAARMLEASFMFYSAIDDFSLCQNSENFDLSSTLAKMSQAYLKDSLVCRVPIDVRDQLLEKVEKVLDQNKKDDLNFNASICYMHLISSNYEQTILFINKSLEKYPDCLHMHYIKGSMFGFLSNFKRALKEFEYLTRKEPKNYEFYYSKAVALRNLEKFDKAIENYEIFIKNSPKDSRKIPEAYYSIGQCKIAKCVLLEKNFSNFNDIVKDYIEKGEHAEQDQLPCFLPYDSASKAYLLNLINLSKLPDEIKNDHQITYQSDDNRIELIKSHRYDIKRLEGFKSSLIKNTLVPPKTQKMSFSLTGLKEVSLKQIDFTKDEVLDGFMINLRVFEYPQFGFTSVFFIVEDENGSFERLSVYNLGNDNDKIREDFKIGVWIAIINPYIRQAADGKPMIRVDDPKSIIFTGKYTEKMCRYCGKSDSKFNCSKCMKALYCSQQCQVNDWKQLNHKLVCS